MRNTTALLAVVVSTTCILSGCGRVSPVHADGESAGALREILAKSSGGAAASGPALSEPTGWGTLSGTFKLNGAAPQLAPLSLTGAKPEDITYCSAGGSLPNERLVVGANNGIRDVLIYVNSALPADDPKWEHPDYAADKTATLEGPRGFDQKQCRFLSHVFAMRSTQRVQIINSDSVGHNTNITGQSPRVKAVNPTLSAGAVDIYEPGGQSSEPFGVSCSVHPWMKAWMITRANPYFAVSDLDGKFEIKNLPAGVELEFRVWQEASGFLDGVEIGGQKLKKGRFKIKLEPGGTQQLDVTIDVARFGV